MEFTISLSTIIAICTTITAVVGAWRIVSKPQKDRKEQDEKVMKMLDNDKVHLDKLDKAMEDIKEHLTFQSDMTYAMLSHMATNNATGEMRRALDEYNSHFRRNL